MGGASVELLVINMLWTRLYITVLLIMVLFSTIQGKSTSKDSDTARERLLERWKESKIAKEKNDLKLMRNLEKIEQARMDMLEINGASQLQSAYIKSHELLDSGQTADAVSLLKKAADGGHSKALYELGRIYEFGELVDRDYKKALRYYKKSADLGDPQGQRAYAFMLDLGRNIPKNTPKAMLYYTFAADGSDIEASMVLGNKFFRGYDTVQSCNTALSYYQYAASRVIATFEEYPYKRLPDVNILSLPDISTKGDESTTREDLLAYIKFNANTDEPSTLIDLGVLYLYGLYGHEIDYGMAKYYLEKLAFHKEPKAAIHLGRIYEFGLGTPANIKKARSLYELAVAQGNGLAMSYLGESLIFRTNANEEPNYSRAYELFVKAGTLRIPDAFLNLAIMHFEGLGVEQDFELAVNYLKNIVTNAQSPVALRAEYFYAEMLRYGIGTSPDCTGAAIRYRNIAEKGEWMLDMERASNNFQEGDIDIALITYEKLAEMGVATAQANAAWIYDEHAQDQSIVPKQEAIGLSVKYYTRAAEQGNEHAHLRLGDYYYFGVGNLTVDFNKAVSFYRYVSNIKAQAHFNMGYMHQYGEGVKKDIYLAKRYYDFTLQMDPDAYVAVYICLFNIGIEYAYQLYNEGKTDQLITDTLNYFIPQVYVEFYDQIMKDYFSDLDEDATQPGTSKGKTKAQETVGFLDRESVFGYKWDTVLMCTLGTILVITLLFRFGIVQIQIV